ncbi:glycosyltransferase family 9 protein [Hymenobacter cheonanensis]|uniref:glycosyltransferase family 9 protein n=1 Tax=Hymenobacter sp. CA2-7 TaxID=3063993 RepID=UPI00271271A6|nr:glycosyltransferase family 9 protein [Hymenobacter sp. CA2-7]MDO7886905.1 glycosyltransferase family 9 protein [Hymenobacter sp. CA2-7]
MLASLLARFRQFRRQRRQQRQVLALSRTDAAALATQAAPDARRVLVVRNDSIGDYLLYRPWLRRLSAEVQRRGQRLTLLANELWAPLASTWDGDLFAEVIPFQAGRFMMDLAYRADILRQVGSRGFGEVIYPLHVREAAVENFIRFMKAPVRVASQGEHRTGPWFELLDAGYTRLLPSTRAVLFEYDRNREFFENWLGSAAGLLPAEAAPLALPAALTTAAAPATPYIVLFPGASAKQKRWPTGHFAQLAQALHKEVSGHYQLVLAGSPADATLARQIEQAAGAAVPLLNRCGQTDLPGLAALVAGASLLISNDTVAAHLAAQAGTPGLVLLMGENYGKFFPYPPALLRAPCRCLFPPSQEVRFAQGDFSPPAHDPDLSQLAPARVLAAARELLGLG